MPHQDNLQPDFNHKPDSKKQPPNSLSHEIDELQNGIKVDFDQKLSELSDLLQRFKALVVSTDKTANREAANEPNACGNDDRSSNSSDTPAPQTTKIILQPHSPNAVSEDSNGDSEALSSEHAPSVENNADDQNVNKPVPTLYAAETARFENGLYKLNSQLYRFRLELDQEMEFREEPLHVHFSQESELSQVLQQMNQHSIEKHPGQ